MGRNDSNSSEFGFGNRHNSVGPRVHQPLAMKALKVATERTKTHYKGAGDYVATLESNGGGFKTSSMKDKDLVLAGLLDEHAVKKKYAAMVREQAAIVKKQGSLYAEALHPASAGQGRDTSRQNSPRLAGNSLGIAATFPQRHSLAAYPDSLNGGMSIDPLMNMSCSAVSDITSVKNSHFSKPRMTLPQPNTYYGSSFCE